MATEVRLEGRTVAVTGATGFIGHAVARRLAAGGASVIGATQPPTQPSGSAPSGSRPGLPMSPTPPRRLPRPVIDAAGRGAEIWAGPTGTTPAMTRHSRVPIDRRGTVSTRRLREELDWEPHVGIDEGIARTEKWLRESGLLWPRIDG